MSTTRQSILVLVMLIAWAGQAQHTPLTSQYLFNGLLINPAYAGSRDALTANITHRQQWVGFSGAPTTQLMSIHAPLNKRKVGLGMVLYNDRIGVSNETGLMTNYAYRIRFPHGKLALGMGVGMTMLRGNWHTVALQDAQDANFMEPTRAGVRPNFSTGAYYYSKRWFAGLSAPFLLSHQYGVEGEGFRITDIRGDVQGMLTGGFLVDLDRDFKLKPSLLVRHRMNAPVQADLNANLIYRETIWLGFSYRTGDAAVALLEILPTPQWRLGYAYDMGISALRQRHHGSHELMVQYEFGYRIRVRDPRHF